MLIYSLRIHYRNALSGVEVEVSLIYSLCVLCSVSAKHFTLLFKSNHCSALLMQVIRVVKRSGLCRYDLIEVVEVALAR